MSKFVGIPVATVNLIKNDTVFTIQEGTVIDKLLVSSGSGDTTISGIVVGMGLGRATNDIGGAEIYDGIAINSIIGDSLANIENVSDCYRINVLAIKREDGGITNVRVAQIQEIFGTFPGPNNSLTMSIDMSTEGASFSTYLDEVADNTTMVLNSATISENITITKALTIVGANGGIPQNSYSTGGNN